MEKAIVTKGSESASQCFLTANTIRSTICRKYRVSQSVIFIMACLVRMSSFGVQDDQTYNVDIEVTLFINPHNGGILIKINGELKHKIVNKSLDLKQIAASKPIRLVTYMDTHLSIVYDLAADKWILKQHGVNVEKLPAAKSSLEIFQNKIIDIDS